MMGDDDSGSGRPFAAGASDRFDDVKHRIRQARRRAEEALTD